VTPCLELLGIQKRFRSVTALDGADFVLRPGTVHALLGENGAGKTTLMQIAFGLVSPDAGTIRVGGQVVRIASPRDARRYGIGMVHQHFTSVGALTVAENLELARGPTDGPTDRRTVDRLLAGLDRSARVESLSVGLKQRLEIAKALSVGASILLLDEPTAVLVPSEIDELLNTVREFAASGGGVVFITHKLDEVFAGADEVTVLRAGRVTLTGPLMGQTRESLARAMIGEGMPGNALSRLATGDSRPDSRHPPAVILKDLTVPPMDARSPGLLRATLSVLPGEIVGVAAVEGNGQRELMLSVAGVLAPSSGTIDVARPVALVPEDRTTEGLIPLMSLVENVVLGRGADPAWTRGPWIDWPAAARATGELLARYDVRAAGPHQAAALLSGGNQQKLVLARGLATRPRVLVVENPTRGLDLRATALMYSSLRDAAAEGVAVLVHSSDLDEVLQLATRLVVLRGGALTEFAPPFERGRVGQAMLGVGET